MWEKHSYSNFKRQCFMAGIGKNDIRAQISVMKCIYYDYITIYEPFLYLGNIYVHLIVFMEAYESSKRYQNI